MPQIIRRVGLVAIAILMTLCSTRLVIAEDKLRIYTVNYPLAYFAERIAGDLADVTFPAPRGVDPAFWMPDPETIAAYQAADLILLNGAGYAKWTAKVSLPRSRLVDTSRAFKDTYIHESHGISHSHGPGGEHDHGGMAFTTWLDLNQAAKQGQAIAQALTRERPDAKDRIERNLESLQQDLLELDERIAEISQMYPGRPLLASHPVYQYLARRYGLNLRSVTWEPEAVPSESQWSELEGILRDHPAAWMIWEGEPAQETIERLRGRGVESVVVNTCANRPSAGDFLTVMTENARSLHVVFGQVSGEP
jgi:zinc transport system substrate-binding protein